jgi:hypothetical protein
MRDNDELDAMLDSALASYAEPGPDAGLEQRILARVSRERATKARRRWMPWAFAIPVAACLVVLALFASGLLTRHSRQALRPGESATRAHAPAVISAQTDSLPVRTAKRGERMIRTKAFVSKAATQPAEVAASVAPLPKLEVFPTPQPLSPAEQELATYAANAPVPERQSLIEANKQSEAPLKIAAIHIPPLEAPNNDANPPKSNTN